MIVDVHNHWIPRELIDAVESLLPDDHSCGRSDDGMVLIRDGHGSAAMNMQIDAWSDVDQRLKNMDRAGIDVALLSAACYSSWITLDAARLLNDAGADLMRKHGGRLRPMIHVPPFGQDGILEEMDRAAKLGLQGVSIASNFNGRYPDEAEYLPFLHKAAELDLAVFIHAAGSPVHAEGLRQYDLVRTLGRSLEHTMIALRMLYSGRLAGLPELKIVVNHLGGSFFSSVKRYLDVPLDRELPAGGYRRLLDQMLFETAPSFFWSPIEIECAVKSLGVPHVALGSDYPAYPMNGQPGVLVDAVGNIRGTTFTDAEKEQIMGGNAERFFGLRRLESAR